MKLEELPPKLLQSIFALVLSSSDSSSPSRSQLRTSLLLLSRQLHPSVQAVIYSHLTLQDDDQLLLRAEQDFYCSKLARIWHDPTLSALVTSLTIASSGSNSASEEDGEESGMAEKSFLLLLSKLPNLTSFSWESVRVPPTTLTVALGTACRSLLSFKFSPSSTSFDSLHSYQQPSPTSQLQQTASSTRYDIPSLSSLPFNLTSLALSSLSLEGSRSLSIALSTDSLPLIENLIIEKTIFVDDGLMNSIGIGAKKLKVLEIKEMGGTKLTEKGLKDLFELCGALEELTLDRVEGRLPKSTWAKLSFPSSLHSLRISYSESPPHKSWILDHLSSLPSSLSTSSLHTLSITRLPPPASLIPGQHSTSLFPISDLLAQKSLPEEMFEKLLERKECWKVLEFDFWTIDLERFKKLVEKCGELRRLKVALEGSFKSLLTLASSFSLVPHLSQLIISIDPKYTPELTSSSAILPSSPSLSLGYLTPTSSPSSKLSPLPPIPTSLSLPASPPFSPSSLPTIIPTTDSLFPSALPLSREWKKFLRKSHALEYIKWGGRGGMGIWYFSSGGKGGMKIEFEGLKVGGGSACGGEVKVWGGEREGEGRKRERRKSEVSLKGSCLSELEEGVGLGLDLGIVRDEDMGVEKKEKVIGGGGTTKVKNEFNSKASVGSWTSLSTSNSQQSFIDPFPPLPTTTPTRTSPFSPPTRTPNTSSTTSTSAFPPLPPLTKTKTPPSPTHRSPPLSSSASTSTSPTSSTKSSPTSPKLSLRSNKPVPPIPSQATVVKFGVGVGIASLPDKPTSTLTPTATSKSKEVERTTSSSGGSTNGLKKDEVKPLPPTPASPMVKLRRGSSGVGRGKVVDTATIVIGGEGRRSEVEEKIEAEIGGGGRGRGRGRGRK